MSEAPPTPVDGGPLQAAASLFAMPLRGAYPQREPVREHWFDRACAQVHGRVKRMLQYHPRDFDRVVGAVARHGRRIDALGSEALVARGAELARALAREGLAGECAYESFALVRELAGRLLGKRHYDVQVYAAWVMLRGNVAEMNTGEGKTLTAALAAATAALAGIPTHVISVNDYLVSRDAESLRPLYEALGLTVGTIVEGMSLEARRAAYACDITYCTNKELVFDYLKDRITLARQPGATRLQIDRLCGSGGATGQLLMRGLHYALIDEADSVLIDEARVPVIISKTVDDATQTKFFEDASALAATLRRDVDYLVDVRERRAVLTEQGRSTIAGFAAERSGVWRLERWREESMLQAIVAKELYVRDQHYLVIDDKIQIVDEFTGRTMADRSWEMGLHQLIEAKEGVTITGQREPMAKISYQRFFRRYLKLAGMSGTLREVADELWDVYRLHTVAIPTHRPSVRKRLPDCYFAQSEAKWSAVVEHVKQRHARGQPVLIGTRAVGTSEALSRRLAAASLPHRVLNARQDAEEADIVQRAGEAGQITVATNMAGRGTDIAPNAAALAAGGLHVIATERHEAGRIDRQLFGRAARQGDPGSCECLLSIEDELIVERAGTLANWLARHVVDSNGRVPRAVGAWLFNRTQRRLEQQHRRIRQQLLDLDERRGDMLAFTGAQE